MRSYSNTKSSIFTKNKEILIKFLTDFIKKEPSNTNKCFNYKTIFLSNIIIQGLFNQQSNYIFVSIFSKDVNIIERKLFLLHIFLAYKNLYLKLAKSLDNKESLFSLIFLEILLVPLIHNFDNVYKQLEKKIDLILFDNSEYITSLLIDLNTNEIICDLGTLLQKHYKVSILQFQNRKEIIEELVFHGLALKNNYIKSVDKKIDLIYNSKKIELRATFPKPLFIIKFVPTLQGTIIIHLFNQYKLAKVRKVDQQYPNAVIYENYREVDVSFFNLFSEIDENHFFQINLIEKFFFEYFLLLGNNIKEVNVEQKSNYSKIMTYKNRDYNLLYLNKEVLKLMKNIIMEYFKDEKDLLYKIKKNLNQLYKNPLISTTERSSSEKNPLEFTYNNFINEFNSFEFNNNNNFINLNDINIFLPDNFSNVNEYSDLNLTKENFNEIKRNITTSKNENLKNNLNIYSNSSIFGSSEKRIDTKEGQSEIYSTNEPFVSEATNIDFKSDLSRDESAFRSILQKK